MWEDYSHMTQHLKPGSFIVTTTGRFSSTPWLECVEASRLRQGWGSCGLFIHRRLPEGLSDPRNGLDPRELAKMEAKAPGGVWESDDVSVSESESEESESSTDSEGSEAAQSETGWFASGHESDYSL
mmetsp:Transcript_45082/g.123661  ORF Transcript_45082/g.123661 Transcript_45082/m.123661 type:complete len:127 (+) Transcript_45082:648-1028(+)